MVWHYFGATGGRFEKKNWQIYNKLNISFKIYNLKMEQKTYIKGLVLCTKMLLQYNINTKIIL